MCLAAWPLLSFAMLIPTFSARSQETPINCTDSFCIPAISGMPRSKGIIFRRENVLDYGIRSIARDEDLSDGNAEVRRNRRYSVKFRVPFWMRPGLKLALGLNYFVEEYRFENTNELDYPLYQRLEDKSLKRLSGNLYMVKPFRSNKYILARGSISLNGDYTSDNLPRSDFLRGSLSVLYGVKKNSSMAYAFGIAGGYNLGRRSIIPIFAYSKTFNQHWGLDLTLPARAQLRYTANRKNIFYLKTEIHGSNYNIQLQGDSTQSFTSYHLEKSELRYLVTYEREIHDWLWFGAEAGMRSNFELSLTEVKGLQRDLLIQNKLNEAFLFNISFFIVPPLKYSN